MPASSLIGEAVMEKFVRVKVAKGRKFRGEAYDVGCEVYTSTFNIYGTGRNGWRSCESLKLWSPTSGWVYANPSYIEPVDCDTATLEADKAAYVAFIVDGTVEWCSGRSKGKTEREVLKFAHNVLRKHHPDMLLAFEEKYDYKDDVVDSSMATPSPCASRTAPLKRRVSPPTQRSPPRGRLPLTFAGSANSLTNTPTSTERADVSVLC